MNQLPFHNNLQVEKKIVETFSLHQFFKDLIKPINSFFMQN